MNKFPVKVVISIVGIAVTAILVCFLHSVSIPSQSSYYIEQTGECYCLVSPDLGSLGQEAGKQIVEVLNEWKDLTETYTQMALAALLAPLIFLRSILGGSEVKRYMEEANCLLVFSFVSLSAAVISSMSHQISATSKISDIIISESFALNMGIIRVDPDPRYLFKLFVVYFCLGIIFFVVGVLLTPRRNNHDSNKTHQSDV